MKYSALGKSAGKVMKMDSYGIKHLELFHDKLHKIYSNMYQTLPLINIIMGGACLRSSNPSAASVRIQSDYLFTLNSVNFNIFIIKYTPTSSICFDVFRDHAPIPNCAIFN